MPQCHFAIPNFRCSPCQVLIPGVHFPLCSFSAAAPSATMDDLISWSSPSTSKCDSVKSSVLQLYKASTPVQPGVAGSGQFSPVTPFSFVQDSAGFLAPPHVISPVEPNNLHPQRTIFPTMGKLGRLEYPLHPAFNHSKPTTPFSGGHFADSLLRLLMRPISFYI